MSSQEISPQSVGVMSNLSQDTMSEEKNNVQAAGGKNVEELNLFNLEVDDKPGQDKVLVGPNSDDDYLTRQAAKLHQQFHTLSRAASTQQMYW